MYVCTYTYIYIHIYIHIKDSFALSVLGDWAFVQACSAFGETRVSSGRLTFPASFGLASET